MSSGKWRKTTPAEDRFWSKVQKGPTCWMWTGAKTKGYGKFFLNGKNIRAHRFSFELVAKIPYGLSIDHLCRVTACVNPAHLEAVTTRENNLRGNTPAGINSKKTKCLHGHEYSPKNTLRGRNRFGFHRQCRTCDRERKHCKLCGVRDFYRRGHKNGCEGPNGK